MGAADDRHLMWLETPATESEKPSLPKLLQLNVVTEIGTNYRTFGTLLLHDETGCVVDAIEHDSLRKAHDITLKILQEWLMGKGEPRTWQNLVNIIRFCELNTLATKIEEKYLST